MSKIGSREHRQHQDDVNRVMRAQLDCVGSVTGMPINSHPKKGTDPMNPISITISISEIENGVIVTTGREENYALSSPLGRGSYYQDLETVIDSMDDIIGKAWERAKEHQARYDRDMIGMVGEKRAYAERYHRSASAYPTMRLNDGPEVPNPLYTDKLPEERAVDASENIPVIDEDEVAGIMVRDEPVMNTSAFDKGSRDSET